ncbi:hypothetical protein ACA910_007834 [Epithemia clementina (nom. ined.)]
MGGSLSAFQSLCSRLEENDPTAVVVNTDSFPYFDPESAQQLGLALKNNHHVQKILLDVTNLSCRGPDDGVTSVASFIKSSPTLKTVLLKSPGGLVSTGAIMCPTQRADVCGVVAFFLSALAESSSVDELSLADIDLALPRKAFLHFLTECRPNLRRLRLSYGRSVEPSEMTVLMNAFAQNKTLKGLELTDVPESIWSACLAGVAMNETLHSLNLHRMSNDYDQDPLTNLIENNTSICSLSINQSRIPNLPEFATSLQRNENIVELILTYCWIGVQDAVHIKRLIKGCPNITRLNLSGNDLRSEGLAVLADGLYRNQSLTLLDVSDNALEGRDAGRTLGNILRRNRTLERLDVDRNNWSGPTGLRACANGLARNQSVVAFDMSGCRLDNHSMYILAKYGLRHNRHVQALALNSNLITGSLGLSDLVDALKEANSVQSLFMNDNHLNNDGSILLADLLSDSRCPLHKLSINNNSFGDEGVIAIAGALQTNQKLEFLSLEQNTFGKEAMEALCRSLRNNKSLKHISFSFDDPDWKSLWYDTLAVNEGLTTTKTPGLISESSTIEAKLSFYAWRNQCRPLMMQQPSSQLDGIWAQALGVLSQKSQYSTIFHVLRGVVPGQWCASVVGRKRSLP